MVPLELGISLNAYRTLFLNLGPKPFKPETVDPLNPKP